MDGCSVYLQIAITSDNTRWIGFYLNESNEENAMCWVRCCCKDKCARKRKEKVNLMRNVLEKKIVNIVKNAISSEKI